MINPIIYLANRAGIPRIESRSVKVNTGVNVAFSFASNSAFAQNFSGLVLVKLSQAVPTAGASLPVVFQSDFGTQALTNYGGAAINGSELAGTGIYLMYYDRAEGTLQALDGV